MPRKVDKSNRDARIKRTGVTRTDREESDRESTQDRELSDSERVELLNQTFFQHSLPDLPKKPGFHRCWLTTQNPRDPIHGRIRLGYRLLKRPDLPGWEHSSIKGGDFEGCIAVNEMIAAELPIHLYEMYMTKLHHEEPLQQEQSLVYDARNKQEEVRGLGAALIIAPGTMELGKDPGVQPFSEQEQG